MPEIKQTKFLGATIANFSVSMGWNEQQSELRATLYEDTANTEKFYWSNYSDDFLTLNIYDEIQSTTEADVFNPPPVGYPVYFKFGDGIFAGILQSYEKFDSVNGIGFTVVINDPRELLAGTEVVVSNFNGITSTVPNVLNVFGYWESIAFGTAQLNPGGMPWQIIRQGISNLVGSAGVVISTPYGGPRLRLRGYSYRLDLSQMPDVPSYYRVPGPNMPLLEMLQLVCQDFGHDFFIELIFDGEPVIRVRTVSRILQPVLGQMDLFIQNTPNIVDYTLGRELRNEYMGAFIVGADQERIFFREQTLYDESGLDNEEFFVGKEERNTIWPYWGLDSNGNAIIGRGDITSTKPNAHTFSIDTSSVDVSAIGDVYNTDAGEMRAAIEGYDSWSSYIATYRPQRAADVNLSSNIAIPDDLVSWLLDPSLPKPNPKTLKNQLAKHQKRITDGQNANDQQTDSEKLFTFIQGFANTYYGKKFMVRVPDVQARIEPETFNILYSDEPSDGGFLPEGSQPLGLPVVFEDQFKTTDNKFACFVRYNNIRNKDASEFTTETAVTKIEGSNKVAFVTANLETDIVFLNKLFVLSPRVVVTLDSSLYAHSDVPAWWAGLIILLDKAIVDKLRTEQGNEVADAFDITTDTAKITAMEDLVKDSAAGQSYLPITPRIVLPDWVAVPLKSNTLTYGPWQGIGGVGKMYFEKVDTLTPWNYGGFTQMNIAGSVAVNNRLTLLQSSEMASVTFAGAPTISIGDFLQAGGPIVTNMDISIDPDGGILTKYSMRTYTSQFGKTSKSQIDRLERINRSATNIRRNMRSLQRNNVKEGNIDKKRASFRKERNSLYETGTPHPVIFGSVIPPTGIEGATINISFGTMEESMLALRASEPEKFRAAAMMGLEGLFVPFAASGNPYIPSLQRPTTRTSTSIDAFSLNPFVRQSGTIVDTFQSTLTHGDIPPDSYDPYTDGFGLQTYRGIALRNPMMLAGWGYDTSGRLVGTGTIDYRSNPSGWMAGPLDVRWDNTRKVWTGGSTVDLGAVIAHSGNMGGVGQVGWNGTTPYPRPRYCVRGITNLDMSGNMTYDSLQVTPAMSGMSDYLLFNIQEGMGDLHTVGVGSPVLIYNSFGIKFISELPRSFARLTEYV